MNKILNNKLDNFKYFSYFVIRAFLLSIFCLMIFLILLVIIYFADILLNVNGENSGKPLFKGYIIISQSMVPTININDGIIVKRYNDDKYNVGDIISYVTDDSRIKGSVVTHRIVNKEYTSDDISIYTTKGDNNNSIDASSVYTNMINGKVMFRIPKIGYIYNFLSNPINFMYCMIGAVILFIFGNISRTVKQLNSDN